MRSKAAIVLDALEAGLDVRLTTETGCSITVALGESQHGETCFSMCATRYRPEEPTSGEEVLLPCDITMTSFIRYCEKLSEKEIALLIGSIVITAGSSK